MHDWALTSLLCGACHTSMRPAPAASSLAPLLHPPPAALWKPTYTKQLQMSAPAPCAAPDEDERQGCHSQHGVHVSLLQPLVVLVPALNLQDIIQYFNSNCYEMFVYVIIRCQGLD